MTLESLKGDAREQALDALNRRAASLAKITAVGHGGRKIDILIALHVDLLVRSAIVLLGEGATQQVLKHLVNLQREDHGICPFCKENTMADPQRGMCATCWMRVEEELREVEDPT